MGTVSDLQSHFPFDAPTQGDIKVPVDTRIIVFSGDINVSLITTIAKIIVILQETAYMYVLVCYVSNNHVSLFSPPIMSMI